MSVLGTSVLAQVLSGVLPTRRPGVGGLSKASGSSPVPKALGRVREMLRLLQQTAFRVRFVLAICEELMHKTARLRRLLVSCRESLAEKSRLSTGPCVQTTASAIAGTSVFRVAFRIRKLQDTVAVNAAGKHTHEPELLDPNAPLSKTLCERNSTAMQNTHCPTMRDTTTAPLSKTSP